MKKKLICLVLALICAASLAAAETITGVTAASATYPILSPASGTLSSWTASVGDTLSAGDELGSVEPKRVFAEEDGTVAAVYALPGETVEGVLLSIYPMSRYLIYCTVDHAYDSAETSTVHVGETVYIRCTKDTSHRAIGTIIAIDGMEYRVETTAGELFNGETVYLYRDAAFTSAKRVGIGTAIASEATSISCEGSVLSLRVNAGDRVERGQLLFTWTDAQLETEDGNHGNSIVTESAAIVTEVLVKAGDTVSRGATVAWAADPATVVLKADLNEEYLGYVQTGTAVTYTRANDAAEAKHTATVISVSKLHESGTVSITLQPDEALPIGLSVELYIDTGL